MNEYNLNIDFCKGRISTNLRKLVQNDYNTTKLNFTFDKEGRVLFKMLYPDGTQYVDEIQNNELIFGEGVLNQEGTYEYEISLYTEDGRLTDYAVKSFEVRSELVDTDEIVEPDDRVPVLDNLINEVTAIKTSAENGEFNGEDGITPTIGDNGNWFLGDIDTGLPSKGEKGEPGSIKFIPVTELPTENIDDTAIYVKPSDKPDAKNKYEEFIYVNNDWEPFGGGGITVNLDNYVTKEELNNNLLDKLTAFYWDGNTGTSNPNNIALFQSVVDAAVAGKKVCVVVKTNNTANTSIKEGCILFPPSDIDLTIYTGKVNFKSSGYSRVYPNTQNLREVVEVLNKYYVEVTLSEGVVTAVYALSTRAAQINSDTGILARDNRVAYTPSHDYNPATKKYVDDLVGDISTVLSTLTTVSEVSE